MRDVPNLLPLHELAERGSGGHGGHEGVGPTRCPAPQLCACHPPWGQGPRENIGEGREDTLHFNPMNDEMDNEIICVYELVDTIYLFIL